MIPVGHSYRAGGRIDLQALLSATILGVVTAVVAAAIVWACEMSGLPTPVILTPLAHGFLIGFVLAFLIGKLRLRHPKLMTTVGLACGLASVGLLHWGHYLHALDEFRTAYHEQVQNDPELTPEQKQQALNRDTNPLANDFLRDRYGYGGFVGSLCLRAEQGYRIGHAEVSGIGTWILWTFETLAVVLVAAFLARSKAATPFCEDCGEWCSKGQTSVQLAGESSHALANAVRHDDTSQALELLELPVNAELLQTGGTRVALHSCAACDQTFADVENYTVQIRKGKAETLTKPVLKLMRVSPEMTALLRGPRSAGDGTDVHGLDGEAEMMEAEADDPEATEAASDPHWRELHPDGTPLEHRDL